MTESRIHYEMLVQDALRNVIRKVLANVADTGTLPGEHHFFITFLTNVPGVQIGPNLMERYPKQMTIVVQHQFWDLYVRNDHFRITLSFDDTLERLLVPFSAIRVFYDPAVSFEAVFDIPTSSNSYPNQGDNPTVLNNKTSQLMPEFGGHAQILETSQRKGSGQPPADVVSLDTFRKKR
ncbi:MAG: hypothetical protein JSC085_000736 [Candidatus Tokpelaia sp. JSC085]|nr:MAG: hypothetical protein JSC085_000736 [Candidatus Tokpelaia sp. JSC085]